MLKELLLKMPPTLQYVVVIALVMLILYGCLLLTRLIGQNRGKKEYYDDPEAYEKTVPDIFASTFLKRKPASEEEKGEEKKEEKDGSD